MKQIHILHHAIAMLFLASACTTANPGHRVCTENQPLRCDGASLVTCNGNGTDEVELACPLGCSEAGPRCIDPIPSNSLARHLELSSSRTELHLGESATIDTDTGAVMNGDTPVDVDSDLIAQPGAPNIRVLIVRHLTANNVTVTGSHALAIVSGSDIAISGTFAVSAQGATPGAGAHNEDSCAGKLPPEGKIGGAGGGGFGSVGAPGGRGASLENGQAGIGGDKAGTATLTPLRGGCRGGEILPDRTPGAGGGAIQLVSRNQIAISGVIAANGGGGFGGGGSGGGILLEAPTVDISGNLVANGGGGGVGNSEGCTPGQDGHLDATPADGGGCKFKPGPIFIPRGFGGAGAAGDNEAKPGSGVFAGLGNGGGGVGRIRVNTTPGGLRSTGVLSPNASLGTLLTP